MRILNLELERYGPFTARSLAFRPDAKLHVVFGHNEAGKSSALAGITDLLFGIEAKTEFNFLHENSKLRVGATITNKEGSQLAFRRRKGTKGTFRDSADLPLRDDILVPFLGNLSREVFCHAFGLNSHGLQTGARELLANKGEVGVSLLAAASANAASLM